MAEPTDSGEHRRSGTANPPVDPPATPAKPALFDREEHPSGETEAAAEPATDPATDPAGAAPAVQPAAGKQRWGRAAKSSGLAPATEAALGVRPPEPEPASTPAPPSAAIPTAAAIGAAYGVGAGVGAGGGAAESEPAADVPPQFKPSRWRGRVLPKTALGLATLILAAAVGSAFSGVVLYAYYEYRLAKTDTRVSNFITGESRNLANAENQINQSRDSAIASIRAQLQPLNSVIAQGQTLQNLIKKVSPSMFFIHTLDEAGQPSVGSAFVVASDADQSLLLASYTTIRAATHNPRPDVFARQGTTEVKVTVWTWEPQRDLALLILPKGNLPSLPFIPAEPPLAVGERIFAVSGLGSAGAAVTQGFISDVSASGIQHNASVAPAFQGGPLVDSDGNVMAVASRAYAPLNFTTDSVWFGVPIRDACEQVLKCPAGTVTGPGNKQP